MDQAQQSHQTSSPLSNNMAKPATLVLQDGTAFRGRVIGASGSAVGEVVFNTAMTGYQEILSDPSYARQIITLTYPHIGNTGCNDEDDECGQTWAAGLVIRDLPALASNFRSEESLDAYLRRKNIIGIADVDTRALTRLLRDKGAQNGCIFTDSDLDESEALALAQSFEGLQGMDLAKVVSASEPFEWQSGTWSLGAKYSEFSGEWKYKVLAYDFGVKANILRMLADRGCSITVVPAQTPASVVFDMQPDGVFLSNGPGDPEPCNYAIESIRSILEAEIPIFGICLGHQLLALASGATTKKMKFGHHGANHPVKDLASGRVMITSQNHGFAVDETSLPESVVATHVSLFDGSLQGIRRVDKPAFSFQGHPEASPGPHDAAALFDHFIELMKQRK